MNKYIQDNKERRVIKQAFDNNEISIEQYVSDMSTLYNNMPTIQKEMIKEYDDMSNALLTSDKNNLILQKRTKELEHKLLLTEKVAENATKYHNKVIKKDKFIHTLKESIKTDFLNFGENMMPKSYMRISKRFPHLTLKEIIDFEKKVRENGGSIQVHKGYFRLLNRACLNSGSGLGGCRPSPIDVFMGWDCCPGRGRNTVCCRQYYGHLIKDGKSALWNKSGDLKNKNPNSTCCQYVTFYLKEEDEKKQDINQVKVSDVTKSISHNIKILEKTIEEYSEKIEKLKSIQENLDLLKDI